VAYDETLAVRIADHLDREPALTEKKMFGGLAFMIDGNMAVGVSGNSLMVRVGPENYETALSEPGVRPFGMTGKEMRGWVFVDPEQVSDDDGLAAWVERGRTVAKSLPAK
jgi:TfoX/Sxy family transcriptional regulator of competence genes